MFKVQGRDDRGNPIYVGGNYAVCKLTKKQVYKGICMQKCMDKKCPIVIEKLDKKRKEALKRKVKKLKKEQAKIDEEGVTRNLLLRPEDRIDEPSK